MPSGTRSPSHNVFVLGDEKQSYRKWLIVIRYRNEVFFYIPKYLKILNFIRYISECLEPFLACLNGGDLLQSLKIPGGHIPWNCDADVVVIEKGIFYQNRIKFTNP